MYKLTIYTTIFVLVFSLLACDNSIEPEVTFEKYSDANINNVKDIETKDSVPILRFGSFEMYEKTLEKLRSMESNEEITKWVHDTYPDFISIQDIYREAGEELSESELDTEERFNAFKNKYASLYFPMIGEDAGFYIPIVDEIVSYLANQDCKIIIANKEVDLKDIHNYVDLQRIGRAYYEKQKSIKSGSEIEFYINGFDMNSVGPEYDSGWSEYNNPKRKVKLKARRRFSRIDNQPISESLFHTEFCFRKKTIFGWTNYSCKSTITGTVIIPGFSYNLTLNSNHSGTSSHDKEYPYPIHISNDGIYWYHRFYEAPCQATVVFKDISTPINYSWTMAGLVCRTPFSSGHFPIVPSNL